jgi:4,5-DOPA dioxygenase extradiol
MRTPALFIGHGSPTNVLENNNYTRFLEDYGKDLVRPKAIVVFSAHWLGKEIMITGSDAPKQIYDFYGFPDEMYRIRYEPKGSLEIAELISDAIPEIQIHQDRGIDHAGWAVLKFLCPDADIPTLQISMNMNMTIAEHFEFAKKLRRFRDEGVMFIGSGNLIHNLRNLSWDPSVGEYEWAVEINRWFREKIEAQDKDSLVNIEKTLENYQFAMPTLDHYLPFIYTLGLMEENEKINIIFDEIQNSSISMTSIEIK